MKKMIKQTIALLLVLCMCLPMFSELVFAVGEATQDSTVITFNSTDGVERFNNKEPRFTAGQDFGAWTYIGGKSLGTTKVTGSFIQANTFTDTDWLVLRLDGLASGKYDLTFSNSYGDAKVYLLPGSQVENMDAFTSALNETVDSYLGQLSVSKTYDDVQLPEDGDYLLVFNGASSDNFRVSSIRMIRTGDADIIPEESTGPSDDDENEEIQPEPDFVFGSGSDVTYKTGDSGDTKLVSGMTFDNWIYMGSRASVNLTPDYIQPVFRSAGSYLAVKLNNITAGTYELEFGIGRNSSNGVVEIQFLPGDVTDVAASLNSAVAVGTVDGYEGVPVTQTAGKVTFEEDGSYIMLIVSKSLSPLNPNVDGESTAYRTRIVDMTMYMATADADTPSVKATTPVAPGPDEDDEPESTADYIFSSGSDVTYSTTATDDTKLTVGKTFANWTYMGSKANVSLGSFIQPVFGSAGSWMALRLEDVIAGTYELDFSIGRNSSNGVVGVYVIPGNVPDITTYLETATEIGTVDGYDGAPVDQTAGKVTFEVDGSYLLVVRSKSISPLNTGAAADSKAYRIRLIDLTLSAATADADTISVNATIPATPPVEEEPVDSDYVFSSGDGVTYKTSATDATKLTAGKIFGNWTYMGSRASVNLSTYFQANFASAGNYMAIKLNDVTAGTYDLTFGVSRNASNGVVEVYVLPGDTTDIATGIADATGIGTLDGYEGAPVSQTAGKVTFEADGSYLVVIVAKSISPLNTQAAPDSTAFRTRLTTLDLEETSADSNTLKVKPTGGAVIDGEDPDEPVVLPDYSFTTGSDKSYSTSSTDEATLLKGGMTFGNWKYLSSKANGSITANYMSFNHGSTAWTAIQIDNVKAGTYELVFHISANTSNGVIEVIILPGDLEAKDLANALEEAPAPIGSFDCYKGAAKSQVIGKATFADDGSYTLIFRTKGSSPLNTEGTAYRLRITGLDLNSATADANTPSFSAKSPYVPEPDYVFSSGSDITYTPKGTAEEGNYLKDGMSFGNWDYINSGTTTTVAPNYTQALLSSESSWVAYRLKDVKAGTYNLSFKVSRGKSNGVSDVIILPANTHIMGTYTKYYLSSYTPVGSIDSYSKAKEKQTLDAVKFETDGDYIMLIRGKCASPLNTESTTAMRMRIASLTLLPSTDKPVVTVTSQDPNNYLDKYELYEPEFLGDPLKGGFSVPGKTAMAKVNGHDYYIVPIRGGAAYVFDLDTKEIVDEITGISGVNRGIVVDNHGKVYMSGGDPYLYVYDLHTKEKTSIRFPANKTSANNCWDMVFDPETDLLYIGSNPGVITVYNTLTGEFSTFGENNPCNVDPQMNYIRSLAFDGDYLYANVWGVNTDGEYKCQIWKMDVKTGKQVGVHDFYGKVKNDSSGSYIYQFDYLSVAGGKLFTGNMNNRDAYYLDCETMTLMDIPGVPSLTGVVSEVVDGKAYFIATLSRGLWYYDVNTGEFAQSKDFSRAGKAFRSNINVVGSDADPEVGEKSLIVCTNKDGIGFYNLDTGKTIWWREILEDCGAGAAASRTIANGGPGQIFAGMYQNSNFWYYNINAGTFTVANNNLSQSDSFVYYGTKMYVGCYNGAHLVEFDPGSGKVTTLADLGDGQDGLQAVPAYGQTRIHALAAGENKIFMGSLSTKATTHGHLSWYDLTTGELYVEQLGKGTDSDLQYSVIIELVYKDGLLYGITSRELPNRLEPVAKQGHIFVYDVANRKLLGEFDVELPGIKNPEWIAGINVDPDGKWWGLVDETLFSFVYDRESNTMTYKEEFSVLKDGIYENRGTSALFGRPILFGNDGYIYVAFDQAGGLRRINPKDPYGDNVCIYASESNLMRDYVLGDDGNLYFLSAGLQKLSLNIKAKDDVVVKKVINLIDAIGEVTIDSHPVIFTAREAYRKLTEEQKAKVTNYEVLTAAEARYAQLVEEAEAAAIVERINDIGKVTKKSRSKVAGIRRSYNALSDYAKSFVTNYDVLVAAEKALEEIKVAGEVDELIEAIGEVTLESEAAIQAARDAYEALTDSQKAYVENLAILEAAEAALKELKGIGANNIAQIVALSVAAAAAVAGGCIIAFVPSVRKKIFKRK